MSLFNELRRRNVFRVVAAYVVMSWLLLQVADVVLPAFNVPDWTFRFLILGLAIGFVPAVVFSWIYELTPEGIKKKSEIDRSKSVTAATARKLDLVVIVMLVAVVGLFVLDRFFLDDPPGPSGDGVRAEFPAVIGSDPGEPTPSSANGRKAIAVLPFENLSTDSGTDSFANGLHDDLLTHLSRLNLFKVISRTSVLEYRGTTKNMRIIGEELGVSHLIEGGIQRAGDRVRINVQLIDAQTDEHLWADTFDRALTVENIFDIQSEIATQITQALALSLGKVQRSVMDQPTANLAAYEAYLRGKLELEESDYSMESLSRAQGHYEKALDLDPDYAAAYAGLAAVWDNIFWFHSLDTSDLEKIRSYAQQALTLDPDLPEGHHAMGSYYYHGFLDYDQALKSLSRAEEALAGDASYLSTKAAVHRRRGDKDYALSIREETLILSPRSPSITLELFFSYFNLQRYDDMRAIVDRLEQLDVTPYRLASLRAWADLAQSGEVNSLMDFVDDYGAVEAGGIWVDLEMIVSALWTAGQFEKIGPYLDAMESVNSGDIYIYSSLRARFQVASDPETLRFTLESDLNRLQEKALGSYVSPLLRLQISEFLIHLGRENEAREALLAFMSEPLVVKDRFWGPWLVADAAYLFYLLDDQDHAIDALESALAAGSGFCLRSMMQNPGMEALEQHPRFAALVDQYGWVNEDLSKGVGQ